MSINTEIKGQLAKLLATEDLIIENRAVDTASFDVERRVLTLPLWNRASSVVYDLLVGHEVGHALFTPNEDWRSKVDVPQQFVNVTEDARIEKLMKRKYPGLSKTFYRGYSEMNDADFFGIDEEDLSSFNLADRVNLWFKIGNYANIPIKNEEEKDIIKQIADAETFDDALYAAEILYKYCKKSEDTKEKVESQSNSEVNGQQSNTGNESPDTSEDGSSQSDGEQSPQSCKPDDQPPSNQSNNQENTSSSNDPEVTTNSNLSDNLGDLNDYSQGEQTYLEVPKVNCDMIVVKNSEVQDYITEYFNLQDGFLQVDAEYLNFKKSAQKEVNYLLKEFECKKAADSYARATTARTGVLDCTKLHTYKYNEDLFKKVSVIPDGKNHGLIFILDWSGSMHKVLMDTCKQLFNLIWFCRKANIPFDVYAFTNEWFEYERMENGARVIPEPTYEERHGVFHISEEFRLMNLLTHKTTAKELDNQMKNIWRIAAAYRRSVFYSLPSRLSLSGTPLNESIIAMFQIIPKFKKDNNLQKVQCITLTDGEAGWMTCRKSIERRNYSTNEIEPVLGHASIKYGKSFIRDRVLGTTYKMPDDMGFASITNALLRNIKDRLVDVNFIGIRVMENRESSNFITTYTKTVSVIEELKKQWKKNRSVMIRNSGYNVYFGLSSNSLSNESEFEVDEDASKTQIKRAFVKSLSAKKLNKKVLSEFVSIIS
jgi:hypothetical protein